eukprot:14979476-Alexandrium_andersonii.AAC.1
MAARAHQGRHPALHSARVAPHLGPAAWPPLRPSAEDKGLPGNCAHTREHNALKASRGAGGLRTFLGGLRLL